MLTRLLALVVLSMVGVGLFAMPALVDNPVVEAFESSAGAALDVLQSQLDAATTKPAARSAYNSFASDVGALADAAEQTLVGQHSLGLLSSSDLADALADLAEAEAGIVEDGQQALADALADLSGPPAPPLPSPSTTLPISIPTTLPSPSTTLPSPSTTLPISIPTTLPSPSTTLPPPSTTSSTTSTTLAASATTSTTIQPGSAGPTSTTQPPPLQPTVPPADSPGSSVGPAGEAGSDTSAEVSGGLIAALDDVIALAGERVPGESNPIISTTSLDRALLSFRIPGAAREILSWPFTLLDMILRALQSSGEAVVLPLGLAGIVGWWIGKGDLWAAADEDEQEPR